MTKIKKIFSVGWIALAALFISNKNANANSKTDVATRINKVRQEIKNKTPNNEAGDLISKHFKESIFAQWGNWGNWGNWNNWNNWRNFTNWINL